MPQFSRFPTAESTELADDIRELFEELSRGLPPGQRAYSGEVHPSLDVLETESSVEVVVDVAGIPIPAVRVLFRSGVLVVAGEKAPGPMAGARTFHLVEREFGRFARAIRLNGAFDLQQSRATLRDGELAIVLPKLPDRRGTAHRIAITLPRSAPPRNPSS